MREKNSISANRSSIIVARRILTCLLAILFLSVSSVAWETSKPLLIPWPKEITFGEGFFIPKQQLALINPRHDKGVHELVETFSGDLTGLGYSVVISSKPGDSNKSIIILKLTEDKSLAREAYSLKVDSKISVTARTVTGLFWGTRTVLQLLNGGSGAAIPVLDINDMPMLGYRGLMIDNARSFHSLDFHLQTIKRLSYYKMNKYHIHFSDDQSYTLPSDKFPNMPTKGKHFTKEQVHKLVETAKKYYVGIVAEIDVPGHASALTAGIPELKCEHVHGGAGKICIGKESTYKILQELIKEVMGMIPGYYWHLGADEVHYSDLDVCECGACKTRMAENNFKQGINLYHYFINRMYSFVQGENREMIVWEGFNPVEEPTVNKKIIVCPFDVKHEGRMPSDYMDQGYRLLNTSWTPLYIADGIYMTTPEILARWNPYMFGAGRSPNPFAYWKKFQPTPLVIGAQMCSWANGEKAEEGMIFGTGPGFPSYGRPAPRLQIVAERVWTGSTTSYVDLLERAGIAYW